MSVRGEERSRKRNAVRDDESLAIFAPTTVQMKLFASVMQLSIMRRAESLL